MKAEEALEISKQSQFKSSEAGQILDWIKEEAKKGKEHLIIGTEAEHPDDKQLDKLRDLGYSISISRSGKVIAYWGAMYGRGYMPSWMYDL